MVIVVTQNWTLNSHVAASKFFTMKFYEGAIKW